MRKLLFIIATIMAFTTCCKDEKPCMDPTNPDCQNYDPCFGKVRPSARFIMEETSSILATKDIWFEDSIFAGFKVRFRSELTDAKYKHKWYVGSEIFTSATTPDRDFRNVSRPNYITISHVIEYEPDSSCFPDDDGKDSIAQTFRLIASYNDEFQTYGTFRGLLNSESDSFDIRIIAINISGQPCIFNDCYGLNFINIHKRGDTLNNTGGLNNVSATLFNKGGKFLAGLEGTLDILENNTFEMRYRDDRTPITGDGLWHTFKGRKVN